MAVISKFAHLFVAGAAALHFQTATDAKAKTAAAEEPASDDSKKEEEPEKKTVGFQQMTLTFSPSAGQVIGEVKVSGFKTWIDAESEKAKTDTMILEQNNGKTQIAADAVLEGTVEVPKKAAEEAESKEGDAKEEADSKKEESEDAKPEMEAVKFTIELSSVEGLAEGKMNSKAVTLKFDGEDAPKVTCELAAYFGPLLTYEKFENIAFSVNLADYPGADGAEEVEIVIEAQDKATTEIFQIAGTEKEAEKKEDESKDEPTKAKGDEDKEKKEENKKIEQIKFALKKGSEEGSWNGEAPAKYIVQNATNITANAKVTLVIKEPAAVGTTKDVKDKDGKVTQGDKETAVALEINSTNGEMSWTFGAEGKSKATFKWYGATNDNENCCIGFMKSAACCNCTSALNYLTSCC